MELYTVEFPVPDGYKAVGYRHARNGDTYCNGSGDISQWKAEYESLQEYLILEKLEEPKPVYTVTVEYRPGSSVEYKATSVEYSTDGFGCIIIKLDPA